MTKKETWKVLQQKYSGYPEIKCTLVNDIDLIEAENKLGVKFSDSFKYFLKNYAVSSIGELYLYTLTKSEWSPSSLWSLFEASEKFKKQDNWPDIDDWCIMSNNGSGDPIGIKPNGEVWISYHDSGFEQEKLADDFEEFAYKLLTETLWD